MPRLHRFASVYGWLCASCCGPAPWVTARQPDHHPKRRPFNLVMAVILARAPRDRPEAHRTGKRLAGQIQKDNTMAFDKTDTFSLSRNERKASDKHADFTGSLNIDGVEYWLDAWTKGSKRTEVLLRHR